MRLALPQAYAARLQRGTHKDQNHTTTNHSEHGKKGSQMSQEQQAYKDFREHGAQCRACDRGTAGRLCGVGEKLFQTWLDTPTNPVFNELVVRVKRIQYTGGKAIVEKIQTSSLYGKLGETAGNLCPLRTENLHDADCPYPNGPCFDDACATCGNPMISHTGGPFSKVGTCASFAGTFPMVYA